VAEEEGALLKKRGMLALNACKSNVTERVKTLTCNINKDLVIIPGDMTPQSHVIGEEVNSPFGNQLHWLYGNLLLSGDWLISPAGNMKRSLNGVLGMTLSQNPSSRRLKRAVCVQQMMIYGRMIRKKTFLMMKVLAVIS
jgi:hypothetical protein